MSVTVTQKGPDLLVRCPYNTTFIEGAKQINGRWSPETKTWTVPLRHEAALRDLLLRVYKSDGGIPEPAVRPSRPAARMPTVADVELILAGACPGWAAA